MARPAAPGAICCQRPLDSEADPPHSLAAAAFAPANRPGSSPAIRAFTGYGVAVTLYLTPYQKT